MSVLKTRHEGHMAADLVVSEGHAAAHTLLHAGVSKVTVPLATGLGDQLTGAEEPEEALLEVLGAADAATVELQTNKTGQNGTERVRTGCRRRSG